MASPIRRRRWPWPRPTRRLLSTTVAGWLMARAAQAASRLGADGDDFLQAKIVTARFYAPSILPEVHGLPSGPCFAGKDDLMSFDATMLER